MLFEFGNNLGWYAFLVLIPFIILYLIRPKPVKLKVPSLMFFMKRTSTSTAQSLFRHFQNDLLFFIQLLVLSLLALSIVDPSLILNRDVVSSNIVFVIDMSASSQVFEDGNLTRFDIAKEKVEDLATTRNSLVLLKSYPVVALENVGRSELVRYLDRMGPKDDTSDVAAAISLAGDMLSDKKGRVVVVSDFIESKGVDADVAKNVLESRGITVDFIDTKKSKRNNVGIVNMAINGEDVNIYVKNYNEIPNEVSLKVNNEIHNLNIGPGDVEPFVFNVESNLTKINILNNDDFMLDNSIAVLKPYSDTIKILFVTNKRSKFLSAALNSIEGVDVTFAEPPIVTEGDFDIYLISDVDKNKLVIDTFGSIGEQINNGKAVIVAAQKNSRNIDYEGLLPFEFGNLVEGGNANAEQINKFTKDIDFGNVRHVYELINSPDGTVVSVNNNNVVSLYGVGNGKFVYYGIMEDESDFKLTPGYPIFWNNLIYSLVGRGDLNEVNLRTGQVIDFGNESKTLDKIGIYNLQGKDIVVNLINERESDINYVDNGTRLEYITDDLDVVKSDVDYKLDVYIALLVLLLVLLEFIYIKFRGEIW